MKRIIITGGPGTGKTSLIRGLKDLGYAVSEEKARKVIQSELKKDIDSSAVPWKDVHKFSLLVVESIVNDSCLGIEEELVFFDRGIPDVLGYLNVAGVSYSSEGFMRSMETMCYSQEVFFLPPWEEIYLNDNERKESYSESLTISKAIKNVYLELGYELIDVPKNSIEDRIDFILSSIR